MDIFWGLVKNIDNIAKLHNLNEGIFVLIYFISFIPVYVGLFMIIYGARKGISIKKILKLELSGVKINFTIGFGAIISILGLVAPYLYILLYGRRFTPIFYLVIFLIIFFSLLFFMIKFKNIFASKKTVKTNNIEVIKKEIIETSSEREELWNLYDASFVELNKHTPCRQSFDKSHFIELMSKADVSKYIVFSKSENKPVGFGMITNNFENTPWISAEYFKKRLADHFEKKLIYYLMGIAVASGWRHMGCATGLIKRITGDLPTEAIVGFDHSRRMNFFIPGFADRDGRKKKRTFLDSQDYYIVS